MSKTRYITLIGVSIAVSMILSYIESLIPVPFAVPGIKLGLANITALFLLIKLDWKSAAIVSLIRVLLSGVLFGNIASIAYSLSGAALSIIVMSLLLKIGVFSPVGISVSGAIAHNIGQISMAILLTGTKQIAYWLPPLIVSGIVSGIAIGLLGTLVIKTIGSKIK